MAETAAPIKQEEPPFVPSTADLKPPLDDNAVKAIFDKAAAAGIDNMDVALPIQIQDGAPKGEPAVKSVEIVPPSIPQKFQKSDGTVDEDKLKASLQQLDDATQKKTRTVDDLLAEYKKKEAEYGKLSNEQGNLRRKVQDIPVLPAIPPELPPEPQAPNMGALRAQIEADYQRDPIGTSILLSQAAAERKLSERLAPVEAGLAAWQQERRDAEMRSNLSRLAQDDPRILDPRLYELMTRVIDEDPAILRLKNPHKAAWNEVKDRLRLGEPNRVPAQPSMAPTLSGGVPPSVSSLPMPMAPQTMLQQASTLNPMTEDGRRFEEALKEATRGLWQQY